MMQLNYSIINCYQNCPWQAFNRYVAKTTKYVEGKAQAYGNLVHNAFEKRLASGTKLPAELEKYEPTMKAILPSKPQTEVRLGMREDGSPCGYYDADRWINCRIDVWIQVPGYGLIIDWKTGKRREDNLELRINALLAYARTPELRSIRGRYFWTGEGPAGILGEEHDLSDVQRTFAELDSIASHINETQKMNHWPKREGPLCRWCDVFSCEHNKNPDLYR